VCRLPNSNNLLKNPGLDNWSGAFPTNWTPIGGTSSNEKRSDSENCDASSSLYVWAGGPKQCVGVTARQLYRAGGYFAGAAPGGGLSIYFFSTTDCGENQDALDFVNLGLPAPTGGFVKHSGTAEAPMGARSALVVYDGSDRTYDRLFFGVAANLTDY
jgi:hypothetical protein